MSGAVNDVRASSAGAIHWRRVAVGALLLEAALFAVLIPVGIVFGQPLMPGSSSTGDYTVFFTAVPLACLVLGYAAGRMVARTISSRFVAHGALLGVLATLIYLAIALTAEGGIRTVVAAYGAPLFYATQALRIAGCTFGAAARGRATRDR